MFYDSDISIDKKQWKHNEDTITRFEFTASAISSNEFMSLYHLIIHKDLQIYIKRESDSHWLRIQLFEK